MTSLLKKNIIAIFLFIFIIVHWTISNLNSATHNIFCYGFHHSTMDPQSSSSFLLFLSYCCQGFHVRPTWTRQHRTRSAEEESTSWARRFLPGRHISAEHASAGYIFDKCKTLTKRFLKWGKNTSSSSFWWLLFTLNRKKRLQ